MTNPRYTHTSRVKTNPTNILKAGISIRSTNCDKRSQRGDPHAQMNILTDNTEAEPLQGVELLKWILERMQNKVKLPNTKDKDIKVAYESLSKGQKTSEANKIENELFELKRLLDKEKSEEKNLEGQIYNYFIEKKVEAAEYQHGRISRRAEQLSPINRVTSKRMLEKGL